MNQKLIDCYQKLIVNSNTLLNEDSTQKFKIISYKKVLTILKNLDFEITSGEQLKDIKGIGASSIKKINEILESGTLKILEDIKVSDASSNSDVFDLQKISGIGPAKAKKLIQEGITLKSLLDIDFNSIRESDAEILDMLTHHQTLGVKYFHDLENKIPYKEIEAIEAYLKEMLSEYNDNLSMVICGSYRRKKPTSGDIDILLYHNRITSESKLKESSFLTEFMDMLISNNFITDHLTSIDNPTKYMGFCKFKKFNRRIDIRLISKKSLGSALLYFTGSGEFNKSMRSYALSKQYSINEYGIYKLDKNGNKAFRIQCDREEDIFKTLGLDYVETQDRLPSYKFS